MVGCQPGCNSCNSCINRNPGTSVMREHYDLFKSPIRKASRLGKYTPMMRKDTFLHRMSYNTLPFKDKIKDHTALLAVLIHRLNSMSPNDGRFAYYQNQINQVQSKLDDLNRKHGEMMQGRNNLISYVTANAGNLVPADAINAMVTGNYSAFKPAPIISPESTPQPPPELVQDSAGPPPGPIGSLENAPEAQPNPSEEAPPEQPQEITPADGVASRPGEMQPQPPERPSSANRALRELREEREARMRLKAPTPTPVTSAPPSEVEEEITPAPPEEQYQYAYTMGMQPVSEAEPEHPVNEEESDRQVYELLKDLKARGQLSESSKAEYYRLKRKYGMPQTDVEGTLIPSTEESSSSSSSEEEPPPPPEPEREMKPQGTIPPPKKIPQFQLPRNQDIRNWAEAYKEKNGKYPEGYLTPAEYKTQKGHGRKYRKYLLKTFKGDADFEKYIAQNLATEPFKPIEPTLPKPSSSRPNSRERESAPTGSLQLQNFLTPGREHTKFEIIRGLARESAGTPIVQGLPSSSSSESESERRPHSV